MSNIDSWKESSKENVPITKDSYRIDINAVDTIPIFDISLRSYNARSLLEINWDSHSFDYHFIILENQKNENDLIPKTIKI